MDTLGCTKVPPGLTMTGNRNEREILMKTIFHILTVLLLAGVQPLQAELLNRNPGFELGVADRGIPGTQLVIQKLDKKELWKNPARNYLPLTSANGNPGRCAMIPGYKGVCYYRFIPAVFYAPRNGEIEISFDAKTGPGESGILQNNTFLTGCTVSERDPDSTQTLSAPAYLTFQPEARWKHFSYRFPVKKYTTPYMVTFRVSGLNPGDSPDTLFLDNLRIRYTDSPRGEDPEEFAAVLNNPLHLYHRNDPVEITIRARLRDGRQKVPAELKLEESLPGTETRFFRMMLHKGNDAVHEGKISLTADRFGAFRIGLRVGGRELNGIRTVFVVNHLPVVHAPDTPGWGLGVNFPNYMPYSFAENSDEALNTYGPITGSFLRDFQLLRLSGGNLARIWAYWRLIEPEEGTFTGSHFDPLMKAFGDSGLEPVFILTGELTVLSRKEYSEDLRRGRSKLPLYVYRYLERPDPEKERGAVHPPLEIYNRYLDFCLRQWGKQVRIWEVFNEPGLGQMKPEAYIELLKASWKRIKADNPRAIILGNGVTGDFGMNVVGWCDRLNAADPDYVNFMDAVSFHPYGCALDHINGTRNLYGHCVNAIRKTLSVPKPLWNTECFYLPTAYRKQIRSNRDLSSFGANELLRHILDGLVHNVHASPSSILRSFFLPESESNGASVPNELSPALSALSFFLRDMRHGVTPVNSNRYIRSGYLQSISGKKALGFLYDSRPKGSIWTPGKADVRIFDCFGNPVSAPLRLGFFPCYLTGHPAEVAKALTGSTFQAETELHFLARKAGNELHAEVCNLTGTPGIFESEFAGQPLTLHFPAERSTLPLVLNAPEKWKGELPEVPLHTLPCKLKLSDGTELLCSADNETIQFQADVRDPMIRPGAGTKFWEGSSVELFFDPAPFADLRNPRPPFHHHYVFSVLPTAEIPAVFRDRKQPTLARRTVRFIDGGYRIHIQIPLKEFPPAQYLGFDFIVNRAGKTDKAGLGKPLNQAHRTRFGYPVLRLPGGIRNGDFRKERNELPLEWNKNRNIDCRLLYGRQYGLRSSGIRIENVRPQKAPAQIYQEIRIPAGQFRTGILQVTARYEEVRNGRPGKGAGGFDIAPSFRKGWTSFGSSVSGRDLTGRAEWKTYLFVFSIPSDSDRLYPRVGLGPFAVGRVDLDEIRLTLVP